MPGIDVGGTVALVTFRDGAGREWKASAVVSDIQLQGMHHPALKLEDAERFGLVLVDFSVVMQ
jgi:hypothetical protein